MNSELAQYIEQLLFTQDRVIIPGLGAFVAQPASSVVDHAGGTVAPPNRTLSFDESILLDDGVLAQLVAKEKSISEAEAQQWIERQVSVIRERLEQRDIIAFANVGRLYRNYLQQMLFVPDAYNYSRESYGLPPIQFSTLPRSRQVSSETIGLSEEVEQPEGLQDLTEVVFVPPARNYTNILVLIAGILLISAGIYYWWSLPAAPKATQEQVETSDEDRTSKVEESTSEEPIKTATSDPNPETAPKKEPAAEKKTTPSTSSTKPAVKTCVLVIGVFKDPANIQKLKDKVKQGGFEVYTTDGKGGGTLVGATVDCSTTAILENNREKLRKITGVKDLYVKK